VCLGVFLMLWWSVLVSGIPGGLGVCTIGTVGLSVGGEYLGGNVVTVWGRI
jgi:hypothetical protein